jgi:tyrosyl-tRNA synthetase
VLDFLVDVGIEGGGIYLNNERVVETAHTVTTGDLLFVRFLLMRKSRRTYAVLRVHSGG